MTTPSICSRWRTAAALAMILIAAAVHAEPVTTLRLSGDPANRVDIVMVGDGYTAAEQSKYANDANAFLVAMFAQQPWAEYPPLMNVYRVDVVSAESGASHPERGVTRSTAFGASYNCGGVQRLICVNVAMVNTVVGRSVSATQRDLMIVIVNDTEYGGSGGAVSVASTNVS